MIDTTTTYGEPELPEAQLFLPKKGKHELPELHREAEGETAQIMRPPDVTFISVDMSKPKTEENINI